jgi:hypothetical protein
MMSYRFARRSFLSAIGGAVGFEILLRNMEAAAQGAGPPPRFLLMNWPVGTMKQQYIPTGTGTAFTTSKTGQGPGWILSPFDTPELRPYTIALHGFNFNGITKYGGCHEDGTPLSTTGAPSPGTRANGGEEDDGCAGGPSWDQILLKHAPGLSKKDASGTIIGRGYYNTICDSRIDSFETSTRCLSYGYRKVSIMAARAAGNATTLMENEPLRPTLAPLTTFNDLFSGFVPGGMMTDTTALRILKHKRSVLDYSLKEINRLNTLAPANERVKIDSHLQAVRMLEAQLTQQILDAEMGGGGGGCTMAPMMPPNVMGKSNDRASDYGNPKGQTDDAPIHDQVGQAHAAILRAAFTCDLIRVATFEWSPGTNHVSFAGMDPNSSTIWMHHPLSHFNNHVKSFFDGGRPSSDAHIWDVMVNVNRWYFEKTAAIINSFRTQLDPLATDGGNLLDRTVIGMCTEVADASHNNNGHAALIFGGTKLGMQGGRFQTVSGNHNQLWVTIAQAFLGAGAVSTLASEAYYKNGANPISGLWVAPT